MNAKTDEPGFLKRWSARKLAPGADDTPASGEDDAPGPADEERTPVAAAAPTSQVEGEAENAPQDPPPDLPDVETLDEDSDYSVFLGENVPEDLTRLALRKLWRSDPALANLDGLNDYDSDFSMTGKAFEVVKTAYRVGRGYADDAQMPDAPDDEVPESEAVAADAPMPDDGEQADAPQTADGDAPDETDAPGVDDDEKDESQFT